MPVDLNINEVPSGIIKDGKTDSTRLLAVNADGSINTSQTAGGGVALTDASIASASGASQTILAAAATRTYISISNPSAVSWWINPTGGTAAASTQGSFELIPGAMWTPFRPPINAVTGIAAATSKLTVVSS